MTQEERAREEQVKRVAARFGFHAPSIAFRDAMLALAAEVREEAVNFVVDGYRCRTCNAVFIGKKGHPEPECHRPTWDALDDEGKAAAIRAQGGERG